MSNLFARGVQSSWIASFNRASNRFIQGILAPERAQLRLLRTLLVRNRETAFGREFGFRMIADFGHWQERVPVTNWEDLQPWMARVEGGEAHVLTREPVLFMERSSGTTGAPKLVPYTRSHLEDIALATGAWLFDTYLQWPALRGTKSYWCVAAGGQKATTSGGVPIGPDHDASLFGPVDQWAYERVRSAPLPLTPDYDAEAWRFHTALNLARTPDLGLMSCWSPTFLADLMTFIKTNLTELTDELDAQRRDDIHSRLAEHSGEIATALWPKLALISCWGDAHMEIGLGRLGTLFPSIAIQTKGLMSTEAVVSVPFGQGPGAVCAVTSHVFEFENLDAPHKTPRLLHQLEEGAHYVPIVSTSAGLYRYRTGDVVKCVALQGETPRLTFEGRLDHTVSHTQSTLSDYEASRLLKGYRDRLRHPLTWCIFVQSDDGGLTLIADRPGSAGAEDRSLSWLRDAVAKRGFTLKGCQETAGAWGTFRRAAVSMGVPPEEVAPRPFVVGEQWRRAFMRHDAASPGPARGPA